MAVAANDIFAVAAIGQYEGQRIMLTHTYTVLSVTGSIGELSFTTSVLDALRGAGGGDKYETLYRDCLPPQYTLLRWVAQKVRPTRFQYQIVTRNVAGLHAADTETGNLAAAVTFRTVLAGRSEVGTKHIGPLPMDVSVTDNGLLTAAYKAKLELLAQAMETNIVMAGVGTLAPCIQHPVPPGSYTLIFNHVIGDTVNVMRRRTVGRGI